MLNSKDPILKVNVNQIQGLADRLSKVAPTKAIYLRSLSREPVPIPRGETFLTNLMEEQLTRGQLFTTTLPPTLSTPSSTVLLALISQISSRRLES